MKVGEIQDRQENFGKGDTSYSDSSSVVAVVVTHNRRELLCRCLEGIVAQTYPVSCVIVVDNASSDDSLGFVRTRGFFESLEIDWVRLEVNQGGAGGFYEGIKRALDRSASVIWLMDDDGFPDGDCLQLLMQEMNEHSFIGPIVVSDADPEELAFSFRLPGTTQSISHTNDPLIKNKAVIENAILPFNGVLVATKIVLRLGLPKKEMFIWGDEVEYTWRLKSAGVRIALVTRALFRHPKPVRSGVPMFFNRLHFNDTDSALKLYCLARNSVWNYRTYRGFSWALMFAFKTLWFYTLTQPSFRKLQIVLKGLKDGFIGDFTKHINFL